MSFRAFLAPIAAFCAISSAYAGVSNRLIKLELNHQAKTAQVVATCETLLDNFYFQHESFSGSIKLIRDNTMFNDIPKDDVLTCTGTYRAIGCFGGPPGIQASLTISNLKIVGRDSKIPATEVEAAPEPFAFDSLPARNKLRKMAEKLNDEWADLTISDNFPGLIKVDVGTFPESVSLDSLSMLGQDNFKAVFEANIPIRNPEPSYTSVSRPFSKGEIRSSAMLLGDAVVTSPRDADILAQLESGLGQLIGEMGAEKSLVTIHTTGKLLEVRKRKHRAFHSVIFLNTKTRKAIRLFVRGSLI